MSESDTKDKEKQEKIKQLMEELYSTAVKIRGSWAGFDGRDLLKDLDIWLMKLSDITGVEYHSYYERYWKENSYKLQEENMKKRWTIDISKNWGVDD